LRTPAGVVKLTDFGIAKVFASTHLTATGGVVGTAEFLSPEQAAGKPVSKRSDLYSLGAVLYTLLTGRPPFEGNSFVELLHKHRYAQFDAPQKIVMEIPHDLDEIVCRLLEKDPAKRPPDCLVLGKQLDSLKKKYERKNQPTESGMQEQATLAENRPGDFDLENVPGPSTLMSRLMRAELESQNRQGFLMRLLNRAWVLFLLLVLCVGTIVWAFWPLSADALYERGSKLMASSRQADWERAWEEFLEPLNTNYPDHPYQNEVAGFKKKIDTARRGAEIPSEAQRFYLQGQRLFKEGQFKQAKGMWDNVIQVFSGVDEDKEWVERSQKALKELNAVASSNERWQPVRQALLRADTLRQEGKQAEAETIWSSLETLYRDDPWATEILWEMAFFGINSSPQHKPAPP
jgi:serine/threonine-protein kinase